MTQAAAPMYHWSRQEFLRASEAGVFDHRVELIDGEIWPVVIGSWHGAVVGELMGLLRGSGVRVTTATLPTGDSLPDPDCWVHRAEAEPIGQVGSKLSILASADVLLVVEVADDTVIQDLNTKARLYGRAGYPVYWVVTHDGIYQHTEPMSSGYRTRVEYRRGDRIPLPYAGTEIAVDGLIGPS